MKKTALNQLTSIKTKGFTLVELLVVIALIGVMAIAVLSAINPLEQINKGADTGLRSDTEQLLSGVDRYYAVQTYYSWQSGSTDTTHVSLTGAWAAGTCSTSGPSGSVCQLEGNGTAGGGANGATSGYQPILTQLVATSEVKEGFKTRLTDTTRNPLYLYYDSAVAGATPYGCFKPKSRAFALESSNRCKGFSSTPVGSPFNSTYACPGGIGATSTCGVVDSASSSVCYLCLP